MQRYGWVIGLRASRGESIQKVPGEGLAGILRMIRRCHIRNCSIFLRRLDDGKYYLFSHFEYHGRDVAADAAKMAADPPHPKMVAHHETDADPVALPPQG